MCPILLQLLTVLFVVGALLGAPNQPRHSLRSRLRNVQRDENARVEPHAHDRSARASITSSLVGLPRGRLPQMARARATKSGRPRTGRAPAGSAAQNGTATLPFPLFARIYPTSWHYFTNDRCQTKLTFDFSTGFPDSDHLASSMPPSP